MKQNHLQAELRQYGYQFSIKKSLALYLAVTAGTILVGAAFHLTGIYLGILCGWIVLWIPYFLRNACRNRYRQQRFSEVNTYMEQFLYSFQKSGKVLAALEDVLRLFPQGNMHERLSEAIEFIRHTYDEGDVTQKALALVEKDYDVALLRTMHRFAIQVEKNGGEYAQSILLMLDARRMQADRVYELGKEKHRKRVQIIASIVTSLLLCYLLLYVAGSIQVAVTEYALTQVTTLIVLLVDFTIFYKADAHLSEEFTSKAVDQKQLLECYRRVKSARDSKRPSLGLALAQKRLMRGVQEVFPEWLMEISLLLQSENVQVALQKSYEDAPLLIKPELKLMLQKLGRHPTDMEPYLSFFEDVPLPEIQSFMKMLYSISEGTGGSASSQIADMIQRNQQLLDQAERLKNEDTLAGMYGLFLAPQLTGGAKMMADMLVMFFALASTGMQIG